MPNEPLRTLANPAATSLPNGAPAAIQGFGNLGLEAETTRGIDFRHLWHVVQERLWVVVTCTVAGLVLAIGYLARTPKQYQGHVVLEVEFAEPSVVANEDSSTRMRSMFLASQEALRTIEQNLTNRSLLARVIRSEGLAQDDGRALFGGENIASSSKTSATPSTGQSADANKTQSGRGVRTFTPLE